MSVVWCRERFTNEAEFSLENGVTYKREWLAKIDDPANDREQTILNDPIVRSNVQLLRIWEAGQDQDPTSFTTTVRVRQMPEEKLLYVIEAEYGKPKLDDDGGGGNNDPNQNPLDEDPHFEYTWASYKQAVTKVFNKTLGSPNNPNAPRIRAIGLLNSAKEPFDPQPEFDDDRLVLRFTRNEPNFDVRMAIRYANSINGGPLSGADPFQLLMKPWQAKINFKNGIWYWRVTYEIHFRDEKWFEDFLDHGTYYWEGGIDAANPVKKLFKDEDGHPSTGLLAENGDKLAANANPRYLTHCPYIVRDFDALQLPLPEIPDPARNRRNQN